MNTWNKRMAAAWFALGVSVLLVTVSTDALAQKPAVDPAATQILKRMTDYLGGLQKFSVTTQNTLEDQDISGHRVDYDFSARVTVRRPNKLRAERLGDLMDQRFFYNGKTLTLYNPSDKVYATTPAPDTIEKTITFARESIGIVLPAADLIYRNAFPLLMEDVTLAKVVGKAIVGGVKCDHLLFSRPGVDFQIWVAEGKRPLPHKFVVISTAIPSRLNVTTIMSDWSIAPSAADARFVFAPPKGVKEIPFMTIETGSGPSR
jgi:hypothetical protein